MSIEFRVKCHWTYEAKVSINLDQNGVGGISFVFGSEEKRRHELGGIWSGFVRSNEFDLCDLVDFKGRFGCRWSDFKIVVLICLLSLKFV